MNTILLSTGAIAGIAVAAVVLLVAFWWIGTSNALNQMQVKIDEAASGIDVALTKRYDLLTKALACVKGYAKHEHDTMVELTAMRRGATVSEKSEIAAAQAAEMAKIYAVAENYPQLKADTQFTNLQNSIRDVEEQLQASRRVYNSNVTVFNQKIVTFPASLVASSKHLTKRDFFEAEANKREDVKMEF